MTRAAGELDGWMAPDRPRGVAGFLAASELTLPRTARGADLFAYPRGEVPIRRRRAGLDPQRACCVVAPWARAASPPRRGPARPWRPRPFSPFARIDGQRVGSGLSARDWRRYS